MTTSSLDGYKSFTECVQTEQGWITRHKETHWQFPPRSKETRLPALSGISGVGAMLKMSGGTVVLRLSDPSKDRKEAWRELREW